MRRLASYNIAYPAADLTVERISDLVNDDLSALPGAPRAGRPRGAQP
jgi:hypothetical protein